MSHLCLGLKPALDESASIRDCKFGSFTEVGARTILLETTVGDYSYIGRDCEVAHTTFGKFCSIASHVRINPGNHPMDRVTQSHFTYRASRYWPGSAQDEPEFFAWRRSFPVTIGHDVWVGHGAVILSGRTIGTGAVIGAGSIVTKDVEPYQVVAGNPARTIRYRFSPEIVDGLMKLNWWDWDHDHLKEALQDFRSLSAEAFIIKYRETIYNTQLAIESPKKLS